MNKLGKYVLWILGIFVWVIFLMTFAISDTTHGTNTHQLIIVVSGVCLALYIVKSKNTREKELERQIQDLREENQKLRQQVGQQLVQNIIDKTENK